MAGWAIVASPAAALAGESTRTRRSPVASGLQPWAGSGGTGRAGLAPVGSEGVDLLGLNVDPRNPGGMPAAEDLVALGVRWLRLSYKDAAAGPEPGEEAVAFYQAVLRGLPAGVRVLLILTSESLPGAPRYEDDEADWLAYSARLAARAGRLAARLPEVAAFQVWNEPDLAEGRPEYDPRIPAATYGRLLRRVAAALRPAGAAEVITAGLISGQPGWLVEAAAGGDLPVDGVAVHPYGQRPAPDWPRPDWGFGELATLVRRYAGAGRRASGGRPLPIWITELGTGEEAIQAEYLARCYRRLAEPDLRPLVGPAFWFCWSDAMGDPWGLVRADGTRKPAWESYRRVARELARAAAPPQPGRGRPAWLRAPARWWRGRPEH